jgi:hypothetical protein
MFFLLSLDEGWKGGLVLVLAGAEHEFADGFAGVLAVVEDKFHLLGNGHFDVVTLGEAESGTAGADTFSDLSAEALENLG